jgi:hypothetical protein
MAKLLKINFQIMKKYKVEYRQTELYIVDVLAKDEKDAKNKADKQWNNGNYQETGDIEIEINNIYDVTNTDDPFNP